MPLVDKATHIFEPTDLQCGQAVIAMATGVDVNKIIEFCGTDRETKLCDMKRVFGELGIEMSEKRQEAKTVEELPKVALLSLETPRCWHWSLYFNGKVLDPEHGVLDDFPKSDRKYFWELKNAHEDS